MMRNYQPKPDRIEHEPYMAARYIAMYSKRLERQGKGLLLRSAVRCALETIPKEYRKGVYENLTDGKAFPLDASEVTYRRYRSKFIRSVAEQLELV
jgi:hypothetical protein